MITLANPVRGEQAPTTVATTIVSMVIPVRNEASFIASTLDQVLDQDLEGIELEIFIVDGQSTDTTRDIVSQYAERFPEIELVENPKRLSSAARNLAIERMRGDYLVVIDGHCEIPSRRYFRDLVDAFDHSGADCLGRPQPLNVTQATPLQQAIAAARSSRLGHHPESFIYSGQPQFVPAKSVAVAYRREVFDKVGRFDETFDAHEDGEFNLRCDRANLRCYFTPKLVVNYFPRASLSGLFKQMVRYGRGRVRLARKHPGMWGLGSLIPALFIIFLLAGAVLSATVPYTWMVYTLGIAVYLTALAGSGAALAVGQRNLGLLFRVPVVLATVHFGAGWGVLAEFIAPTRPTTLDRSGSTSRKSP